jgi:Tfp pilus assembly protein PilF
LDNGDKGPWDDLMARYGASEFGANLREEAAGGLALMARRYLLNLYMERQDWDSALQVVARMGDYDAQAPIEDRAVISFLMGRHQDAFAQYDRLVARWPERIDFANNYGYFLTEAGHDLERARQLIQRALDGEPDNDAYLDSMGWVLHKLGKHQEAEAYLIKALAADDQDPEKLEHLGDVYHALGEADKARRAWSGAMDSARERYFAILDKLDPLL